MYVPKNQKAARRPEVTKARLNDFAKSFLKSLAYVVTFCIIILGIGLFMRRIMYSEDYRIKSIEIRGNNSVDEMSITKRGGLHSNMYYYTVDLKEIKRKIETHQDIREAVVEKRLNDKIIITVKEREPIAILKTEDQKILPIDESGHILSEQKLENHSNLPVVITKYTFNELRSRTRCADEKILTAMKYLKLIKHGPERTFLTVKSVDVTKEDAIIIKTASIDEIFLEQEYSKDAVAKVFEVIKALREQGRNAVKIDARYEDVAVICKYI
ncbi:FtsQ-type POTRA domain-containing protein [bacterium]|nr:FtsQ-type POTRA domain-containing protein [bacterium]